MFRALHGLQRPLSQSVWRAWSTYTCCPALVSVSPLQEIGINFGALERAESLEALGSNCAQVLCLRRAARASVNIGGFRRECNFGNERSIQSRPPLQCTAGALAQQALMATSPPAATILSAALRYSL